MATVAWRSISPKSSSLTRVSKDAKEICNASVSLEQVKIWKEKLMHVLLNLRVVTLLKTPRFHWNTLGVPLNILLNDDDIYKFIRAMLGPIPLTYSLEDGVYFYPLVHP